MFMKSNFTGLITAAVLLALGAAATAAFVFRSESSASLTPEQRYQQTLSELKNGNAEGVGEAIRVLGQTNGFEQHATLLEAVLLLRGNRVESALSTLAGLDQEGPLRHEILLAAGEALNRLQRFGEAELALTVVAREQPDNVDGHRWLGATYYDLGAFDGAIVELNHVVRLAPDDYRPHHLLGIMYSDFEQHGDAIREFKEALRLGAFPEVAQEIRVDLAQAHVALHEYDQAMEQLRQVTATGRSRRLEATCLLNTGKPEEAAKAITDARSMGEDSAALSLLEAELLDQNGKPEDAAQLLRKSIATYPAEAQLYYQLGLILQKLGQTEEATARMKEWEGYSQLSTQLTELNLKAVADPRDAALRDQLAEVCEKMHRRELAAMWRAAAESCRRAAATSQQQNPSGGTSP